MSALVTEAGCELAAAACTQQQWTHHWVQDPLQAARRTNSKRQRCD